MNRDYMLELKESDELRADLEWTQAFDAGRVPLSDYMKRLEEIQYLKTCLGIERVRAVKFTKFERTVALTEGAFLGFVSGILALGFYITLAL